MFSLFLLLLTIAYATAICRLGPDVGQVTPNVTISELITNPSKYNNIVVVVSGFSVYPPSASGDSITISDENANHILLRPENSFFSFPVDPAMSNQDVLAIGKFSLQTVVFDSDTTIIKDKLIIYTVTATSVLFKTDCKTSYFPNVPLHQDLTKGSLHTPNGKMGAGYVCLEPGDHMHEHSTQLSSEIVIGVEGQVDLQLDRGSGFESNILSPQHAIFVPPSTPHRVYNPYKIKGCYFYSHAQLSAPNVFQ